MVVTILPAAGTELTRSALVHGDEGDTPDGDRDDAGQDAEEAVRLLLALLGGAHPRGQLVVQRFEGSQPGVELVAGPGGLVAALLISGQGTVEVRAAAQAGVDGFGQQLGVRTLTRRAVPGDAERARELAAKALAAADELGMARVATQARTVLKGEI